MPGRQRFGNHAGHQVMEKHDANVLQNQSYLQHTADLGPLGRAKVLARASLLGDVVQHLLRSRVEEAGLGHIVVQFSKPGHFEVSVCLLKMEEAKKKTRCNGEIDAEDFAHIFARGEQSRILTRLLTGQIVRPKRVRSGRRHSTTARFLRAVVLYLGLHSAVVNSKYSTTARFFFTLSK